MTRIIYGALLATLLAAAFPTVSAQHGTWGQNAGLLTSEYVAYAGPGVYYTEDIAIRGGQQPLWFTTSSNCHFKMEVRIEGQSWDEIYDGGCRPGAEKWTDAHDARSVPD